MHYENECGCGEHGHGGRPGMSHTAKREHHGYCGYHHGGGIHRGSQFGSFGQRLFISKEEEIAHLEEYLKQLKAEATGVEEHIAELKKGQ